MSIARSVWFVALSMTVAAPPAWPQFGRSVSEERRIAIEKLPAKDLLPKPPESSFKPWRPAYTLDDVPEVSLEDPLAECMHETRANEHILATLEKIRRLDRERPKGFLQAIQKRRPDLADLPFEAGRWLEIEMTSRQFFDFTSLVNSFASSGNSKEHPGNILISNRFEKPAKAEMLSRDDFHVLGRLARHRLFPLDVQSRLNLVQLLSSIPESYVAMDLAKVAIFAPEPIVRRAAIAALKVRKDNLSVTDFLRQSLRYPLPSVVENAAQAIIELKVDDGETLEWVLNFMELSDNQEPDGGFGIVPESDAVGDTASVRELVKISHARNCMLCHPPANGAVGPDRFTMLRASVPNPRSKPVESSNTARSVPAYYTDSNDDAIRFDVIYLTPDFSLVLPADTAANSKAARPVERFDFLIRYRTLGREGLAAYRRAKAFLPRPANRSIAIRILSELTEKDDVPPTRAAWDEAVRDYRDQQVEREMSNVRGRYGLR